MLDCVLWMNGLFSINNIATMQILTKKNPSATLCSAQHNGNLVFVLLQDSFNVILMIYTCCCLWPMVVSWRFVSGGFTVIVPI